MDTFQILGLISLEEMLENPGDLVTTVGPTAGSLVTIQVTANRHYDVTFERGDKSWIIPAASLGAAVQLIRAAVIGAKLQEEACDE